MVYAISCDASTQKKTPSDSDKIVIEPVNVCKGVECYDTGKCESVWRPIVAGVMSLRNETTV